MSLAPAADPRAASPFAPDDLTVAVGHAAAAVANLAEAKAHPVAAGTGDVALRLARGAPSTRELATALSALGTRIGLLAIDPDAALLRECLQALCRDPSGIALSDPVMVAIPRAAGDDAGRWDRLLFDWGYVRLKPGVCAAVADTADAYLRSYLLDDFGLLREPSSNAVSMTTLGSNGRFANQLWQYAFLWFYGLRNNCRIQTPRWIGNMLYGIPAEPPDPSFHQQAFALFTGIERHLWTMAEPPVNLDYWGYFQEIPASWRRHRRLLRRLFTPQPMLVELIERWFERNLPADATPVCIHVRRGDYPYFDHTQMPWFRPIPFEWYVAFLREIWPTLDKPMLLLATDDEAAVAPQFADFDPVIAPAATLALPELGFMPDFMAMQRARVLAISNSSFSRFAAMLAEDGQAVYIPSMTAERFEPYDAWMDDDFWARFEA
ncbi:MAG: hypothetical protein JO021_25390 [Alphaproteobacteria bacterium]|nr:hypothetical protein [Alphaproteobacteria bacterium]